MSFDERIPINRFIRIFGNQRQRHGVSIIHTNKAWETVDNAETRFTGMLLEKPDLGVVIGNQPVYSRQMLRYPVYQFLCLPFP